MSTGEQDTLLNLQEDQLAVFRREGNILSYGVIKGIMGSGVVDALPLRVTCECSIPRCEEIIEVSLAKRRQLRRSYPRGFIVASFHANSPEDILLLKTNEFSVVEKPGFSELVADL